MKQPQAMEDLDFELLEKGFVFERDVSWRPTYRKRIYSKEGTHFVLKIIEKRLFYASFELKELILKEKKIGLRIGTSWPNLCGFHEFFYTKLYVVMVYEFYFLGSLEERIERGECFEYREAVVILKNLLIGLEQLKAAGIIHKNLDAGSVYFTRSSLKIGGFEFCGFEEQTRMSNRMHSFFISLSLKAASLSPEVIFNQICSTKTPLYGVAIILYRLYHEGNYPYNAESPQELSLLFQNNPPIQFKNSAPKPFVSLMKGLLQTSLSNRLSFSELKGVLNKLFKELPVSQRTVEAMDDVFQGKADRKPKFILSKVKRGGILFGGVFGKKSSMPKLEMWDSNKMSNTFCAPILSPFVSQKTKQISKDPRKINLELNSSQHQTPPATEKGFFHARSSSLTSKNQKLVDLRHIAPRVIPNPWKSDSKNSSKSFPFLSHSNSQLCIKMVQKSPKELFGNPSPDSSKILNLFQFY